jgi:serine/threonine protein kinase
VAEKQTMPKRIGPFEIVRRIGAGGMAEAFEGRRTGPGGFEQRVCVKRVLPSQANDPELALLFLREARVASALSHRNVVRVIELGEDQGLYLALELVDGADLRRLAGALPVDVAALVAMEIAEALDHAHTRVSAGPIIHRDVTPANILVSRDGDVKLADFGIARAAREPAISAASVVRGNIWYLAPEQLDGTSRGDALSDLFSLGVVLYQCLAGRRPYAGAGITALRALHDGRRTPLRECAPSVDPAMCAIVDRLLSTRPADRFATAAELVDALAPFTKPSSRRALRAIVVRKKAARTRAAVVVEPVTAEISLVELPPSGTIDLPPEERVPFYDRPTQPARRSITPAQHRAANIPRMPERWLKHALGPRQWSAADDATLERAKKRRTRVSIASG